MENDRTASASSALLCGSAPSTAHKRSLVESSTSDMPSSSPVVDNSTFAPTTPSPSKKHKPNIEAQQTLIKKIAAERRRALASVNAIFDSQTQEVFQMSVAEARVALSQCQTEAESMKLKPEPETESELFGSTQILSPDGFQFSQMPSQLKKEEESDDSKVDNNNGDVIVISDSDSEEPEENQHVDDVKSIDANNAKSASEDLAAIKKEDTTAESVMDAVPVSAAVVHNSGIDHVHGVDDSSGIALDLDLDADSDLDSMPLPLSEASDQRTDDVKKSENTTSHKKATEKPKAAKWQRPRILHKRRRRIVDTSESDSEDDFGKIPFPSSSPLATTSRPLATSSSASTTRKAASRTHVSRPHLDLSIAPRRVSPSPKPRKLHRRRHAANRSESETESESEEYMRSSTLVRKKHKIRHTEKAKRRTASSLRRSQLARRTPIRIDSENDNSGGEVLSAMPHSTKSRKRKKKKKAKSGKSHASSQRISSSTSKSKSSRKKKGSRQRASTGGPLTRADRKQLTQDVYGVRGDALLCKEATDAPLPGRWTIKPGPTASDLNGDREVRKYENGAYQCRKCGEVVKSVAGARSHFKRNHEPWRLPKSCRYCRKSHTSQVTINEHVSRAHNDEIWPFKCLFDKGLKIKCYWRGKTAAEWRTHLWEAHSVVLPDVQWCSVHQVLSFNKLGKYRRDAVSGLMKEEREKPGALAVSSASASPRTKYKGKEEGGSGEE